MRIDVLRIYIIAFVWLAACSPVNSITPTGSESTRIQDATVVYTPTDPPTLTPLPVLAPTSTPTSLPTSTQPPSVTPSPIPTYSVLRGVVNEEHVMCFYGPSKAYLYKYGLLGGNRLDILGILKDTGYLQIKAIGGSNPCWMNMQFMDVQGDLALLQPMDPLEVKLPFSPYYGALSSVIASRNGNEVTISWSPLELRAGDDSEQEPYLVETWVCQGGSIIFIPYGVYETELTVIDEAGCSQPSFGRVYGVEKHGYTPYLRIDWPGFED